jgi:hypothetical protein
MHPRLYGSVLDLKVGFTSITKNTPSHLIEKINRKDAVTTSATLGFRVTGYVIKDEKGEVLEVVKKPKEKVKEEHIPDILRKLLKSNNHPEVNIRARDFFLAKSKEMLDYH